MLVKRGFGERTQAKVNEFASRHNVPLLDVIKSGESEVCSIFKRFGLGHIIPDKQPIRYLDLPHEGGHCLFMLPYPETLVELDVARMINSVEMTSPKTPEYLTFMFRWRFVSGLAHEILHSGDYLKSPLGERMRSVFRSMDECGFLQFNGRAIFDEKVVPALEARAYYLTHLIISEIEKEFRPLLRGMPPREPVIANIPEINEFRPYVDFMLAVHSYCGSEVWNVTEKLMATSEEIANPHLYILRIQAEYRP